MSVRQILDAAVDQDVAEVVANNMWRERRSSYQQWHRYSLIASHGDYVAPVRDVNQFLESLHPANQK